MSSAGDNLFAKKVTATEVKATDVNSTDVNSTNVSATDVVCTDLKSTGTITWQTFSPPITADGNIDTLAATLNAGNTGNFIGMTNVGNITLGVAQPGGVAHVIDMNGGTLNLPSTINFVESAGTVIQGSSNFLTACEHLDLTDSSNTFPTTVINTGIEPVLQLGSNANLQNLQNVQTFSALTVNVSTGGSLLASGATQCQLGPTQMFGDINMQDDSIPTPQKHSINNVAQLDCANVQVGTAGTPGVPESLGRLSVVGTVNATSATIPYINLNWAPGSDPVANPNPPAKIDFTGIAGEGQMTEIEGDQTQTSTGSGVPQRTKCSYLDLTDSTNLHPPPTEERYEWYASWEDPKTYFPPQTQIPVVRAVCFDFKDGDHEGWRYFAPQKSGGDQSKVIDPDNQLDLSPGDYIWGDSVVGITNSAWNYAFYGETAPTTIASHVSQIVEFSFTSLEYGYGRIYMALAISVQNTQGVWQTPVVMEETFRLVKEHEGTPLATNPRMQGPITMRWWIKGGATMYPNIPVDGSTCRLYPIVRTDDEATTFGRLQVTIGRQRPKIGEDFPDFPDGDGNAQNSQLFMRGYPLPPTLTRSFNYNPGA